MTPTEWAMLLADTDFLAEVAVVLTLSVGIVSLVLEIALDC